MSYDVKVDLHGLETQDALITIQKYVFQILDGSLFDVIFITGNGSGYLKTTLENFIKDHNDHNNVKLFYKSINSGSYLVYASDNVFNYYDVNFEDEPTLSDDEIAKIFEEAKK
ncbi:recombination and DNA strand exchange inhibitor protein [Mycoplasmopsis edwardii]|uniref:Recombination and DNA strand exchange inhibitor protein n=1 Tax=Mycoplasmopsis edwardii TaxID=53558 RepID=A0A3B0PP59_9BACT|nr:Smr/MutS family protein [Mycoplasmopsis edwardii]SYV97597.1 recombination and DNA strand exchange inhibitor protein [Mycoplasmopsis edwardii]